MKEPIDTPQELGRNPSTLNTTENWPTAEFLAALKAQAKPDMMDDVIAYIAKRASWLQHQHGNGAKDLIAAMANDALSDTFTGRVTWDPMRCPLELHLKSVIRSRLSHDLERAENYEHLEVEDAAEHDVHDAMARAGKPALTATKKVSKYVLRFTDELRTQAADDEEVLKLLDLHLEGVTERRHICHRACMKPAEYHNAFRRLKRLADKISPELRDAALDSIP
jgi:hypothetical protein